MISLDKLILAVVSIILFSITCGAKTTSYYKMVDTNDQNVTIGKGQFITFIGDQCYESNSAGVSSKQGQLCKNRYKSKHNRIVYSGSSFCGSNSSFEFDESKHHLTVKSQSGKYYSFVLSTPPKGVTECAYNNRTQSSPAYNQPYTNTYQPGYYSGNQVYNNGSSVQSTQSHNSTGNNVGSNQERPKRKCKFCNGTGRKVINQSIPTFGTADYKVRCNECGREFYHSEGHAHVYCNECHGTGYW